MAEKPRANKGLEIMARRLVWWKPPAEVLADSQCFLAQVMVYGTADDIVIARRRFPENKRARLALFLLGRVAWDLEGDPKGAEKWFRAYLHVDPRGELAEEALGRLVEVLSRSGKGRPARQAAKQYLRRFPDGGYAPLARTLVSP